MLRRFDAWCQRNAWLLLGLLMAFEAALHWWLAQHYWPARDGCPGGICSPSTTSRIQLGFLFGRVLALLAVLFLAVHAARFLPTVRALPATTGLLVRLLVGSGVATASILLACLLAFGSLRDTAIGAHYASFAVAGFLGGLNLLPRRERTASEP